MRMLCHWHLIPSLRDKETRVLIQEIKMTVDDKKAIDNLENIIDDNYGLMLFQAIEHAKHELSSYDQSKIFFEEKDLIIREDMTRGEFESFIAGDVEKIKKCVDKTISDAGLSPSEIDVVFLTGGSSYVPLVRKIFSDKFGLEKIRQADAFTSVVYGLGASWGYFG